MNAEKTRSDPKPKPEKSGNCMDGNYDSIVFPHREITDRIIGVFYDVFNELGFGYLESVYQNAMVMALTEADLTAIPGKKLPVYFRGKTVGEFQPDILVNNVVILELKAVEFLRSEHEAQLLNYLRATPVEVGLLLNFGPAPKIKRLAFKNERKSSRPEAIVETGMI